MQVSFTKPSVWEPAELSDLLLLYKQMVLGSIRKDNWKELAKCRQEIGWDRSNDHCRHEVTNALGVSFYCVACCMS